MESLFEFDTKDTTIEIINSTTYELKEFLTLPQL